MNSIAAPGPYAAWTLDPQLERDTVAVGDLSRSRVLLMNDANWPSARKTTSADAQLPATLPRRRSDR